MQWPELAALIGWTVLAIDIVLRFVALGVIPGNRKPSTGMAWLLLILIEPIRSSPFLASLDLADRLCLPPRDVPVAALGAALLGSHRG